MVKKRATAAVCAATCAVAIGACGGSSSSGLSQAELAKKVNAACAAYTKAVGAITPPSDFATNAKAAAAYLDKAKPLVHQEASTIEALKPADSIKATFETYLKDGQHQVALFDSADSKAHAQDPSGLQDLAALAKYKKTTLEPLERKLGFTSCLA